VAVLGDLFSRDPLKPYYNLEGLTDVVLTADIDWAPDYAIEHLFELIESFGFQLTVFATHRSRSLVNAPDFVEVGLHPDFTREGPDNRFSDKLRKLKDHYPDACGTRSHRNFFGQNIADMASKAGLIYDASTILWNQPLCQAHRDYNGMIRFSYMWEDGIHCDCNLPFDTGAVSLDTPGLKILNVHPILIYLNSPNDDHRRAVTRRYSDLTQAEKVGIDADIHSGAGIGTFYRRLLAELRKHGVATHKLEKLARIARAGG
jgi:hypothetical protein